MRKIFYGSVFILLLAPFLIAQDELRYETKDRYGRTQKVLTMDFSKLQRPATLDGFHALYHLPPITQDTTGTCWCFSTISFLESELVRKGRTAVKLSEMYIVYWEYVEKVRRFVREHGDSFLGEGSEQNAVLERMRQYGLVRATDYSGLINGRTRHNHALMFREIMSYLDYIAKNKIWDEEQVIATTKIILNKYLGEPPKTIALDGKEITPNQLMQDYLQLNPDDYVPLMSVMYAPFYQKAELKSPDNWWHSEDYLNVPLEVFYNTIVDALKQGYTLAIAGDTSEIGRNGEYDVAVIPYFDLPPTAIGQNAREFRIHNNTTTDDHAMHLVGYQKMGNHTWFLVKDSGGSAWKGQFKGYFMLRDDYVKIKILSVLVHRDMVAKLNLSK
ncbi:MAG: C1 family peptidase [candidate division KSB1 bacterium]|nr:C1 family peptidase [candidate division KSB1 bacterium]